MTTFSAFVPTAWPNISYAAKHVGELEMGAREFVHVDHSVGHQPEEHRGAGRVHQPHADGDAVDPEVLQSQRDRLLVHTDIRDATRGRHDLCRHVERLGHANRFHGNVHTPTVGHGHHVLLPPVT